MDTENNAKRILIIEDEASISDIIQFNLTKEGYQVDTAYDGQEGLRKALEGSPDHINRTIWAKQANLENMSIFVTINIFYGNK